MPYKASIYRQAMVSTLYLSNLPSRPDSLSKFRALLLSSVNSDHRSISNDVSTRFDLNSKKETSEADAVTPVLDEKYQIIEVSRYGSRPLRRSCFVTFKDSDSCNTFLIEFQGKLKINGRKINIKLANTDSFAALYYQGQQKQLQDELRLRTRKAVDNSQPKTKTKNEVLKRRLRRARSKLRKKNLDEETIQKLLSKPRKTNPEGTNKTAMSQQSEKVSSTKKVFDIVGNPLHHVLLVQNLPKDVTQQELEKLFVSDGFKEVRLVSVRNLCFVEYDSTANATKVVETLGHDHPFKNVTIKIGYAKK